MIQLPPLPFAKDALSPHISAETIEYHYGKHHQAYVNTLKQLIPGPKYENLARLMPEVEEMMDTGMIATSDVDYMRIEKPPTAAS